MESILCPWDAPRFLIFSSSVPQILYYALIPGMVVGLFLGFFVFLKNKKILSSKILLFIALSYFIWGIFSLVLFATNKSEVVMVWWSFTILVEVLIYAASLYLAYVFFDQGDVVFKKKMIIFSLLLPLIILIPTRYNLTGTRMIDCTAIEGPVALYFSYALEILFSLWIMLLFIKRYRSIVGKKEKRKIAYFTIGIIMFLVTFSSGNIIGSFTSDWVTSQYGYFGMPIFIGFLSYIIVKYQAFNVKMIAVQALVAALVVLVGAQFFFVHDSISITLTGITLSLSLGFGYMLIKSIKEEIKQREALELANKEINERKEQLQTMADSLAVANDKLRKLDNAKTEFISIASHQLRTPITAIKGFVSLILEGSYGEIGTETKGALEKVYLSSERLVALIEDLLNVSRIESGRMTFEFEKASVEKLLKELYDNFILIAKKKNFYLDLKLPTQALPEITMDHAKVRELVSNFIDNALKYTEKGGVTIKAEIISEGVIVDENGFVIPRRNSGFGKVIRITVSDTGIGVGRDEIPYLFRKFSRGKDVSRLHVGGTGLGLYVGKAIATAHHGQVWVESDGVGMGSRFMIEIPVEGV